MIVTRSWRCIQNVSALVSLPARAPLDAGEDYTALAKKYPTPPASEAASIVFDGDEGRLSEEAFLRDFAGDLPRTRRQRRSTQTSGRSHTRSAHWRARRRTRHGDPSQQLPRPSPRRPASINPTSSASWPSAWEVKTIEVKASHLSLISHPEEIARLILEAAGQQDLTLQGQGG